MFVTGVSHNAFFFFCFLSSCLLEKQKSGGKILTFPTKKKEREREKGKILLGSVLTFALA